MKAASSKRATRRGSASGGRASRDTGAAEGWHRGRRRSLPSLLRLATETLEAIVAAVGTGSAVDVQRGSVGEFLDVAVERSTLDQFEVEVGGALEDWARSVLAGDHGEEGHLNAVDEPGGHQRAIHGQASVGAHRNFGLRL